ncbi:hypothetical protein [Streptomyces sp. NPDC052302]|uniref:hypothetical protein n=1 Tax=Streptomyces sp. NPDC052302 TaxID=3365688 RepID=UPI0037D2850B
MDVVLGQIVCVPGDGAVVGVVVQDCQSVMGCGRADDDVHGRSAPAMLRRGECLVVRVKGKDFAVSVDDAERGAALLNSLGAKSPR